MSRRVLLCDDEVHILRAAEFKLSRAGFEVECAPDGQAGWEAIQRRLPDIVVTDLQMPRLNGCELAQRVRSHPHTAHLPIIMLTAKGYELTQAELAEKWRIAALMTKPFSPRELLANVEQVLEAASAARAL